MKTQPDKIEEEIMDGLRGVEETHPVLMSVGRLLQQHTEMWQGIAEMPDRTNEQRQHDTGRVGALRDVQGALAALFVKANNPPKG